MHSTTANYNFSQYLDAPWLAVKPTIPLARNRHNIVGSCVRYAALFGPSPDQAADPAPRCLVTVDGCTPIQYRYATNVHVTLYRNIIQKCEYVFVQDHVENTQGTFQLKHPRAQVRLQAQSAERSGICALAAFEIPTRPCQCNIFATMFTQHTHHYKTSHMPQQRTHVCGRS